MLDSVIADIRAIKDHLAHDVDWQLAALKADNDDLRAANDNEAKAIAALKTANDNEAAQIKTLTARLDALEAGRR